MTETLISVIVPVYNTGKALAKCLDSLIVQTYQNIEIIVVNDGSNDPETLSICDDYQHNHTNIKLIHQQNQGSSGARNTGIENSRGEYLAFVDSDDMVDKEAYENLLLPIKKYKVPLVLGELQIIHGGLVHTSASLIEEGLHDKGTVIAAFLRGQWHSVCTNLYARSLISDLRFPEKEINEDYIFNYEIMLRISKAYVFTKPYYHYIRHTDSITTSPASMRHLAWLKHTEYVKNNILRLYGDKLKYEAIYQDIFANIVLSNKCLLSAASGIKDEPAKLFQITTRNLKNYRCQIITNPYIRFKLRCCGIALSTCPKIYKLLIISALKLKK